MTRQEEKEKNIKAALSSVGINALILLIMIFAAAWQTPGSGPGDYPGIEVNLGYDEVGSGEIEPATPIGKEEATDDENPPAKADEDIIEPEDVPEPAPVQEEVKTTTEIEPTTLTDPTSDVEIKEEIKEKPVEKPVEKKPVVIPDKPVEKPIEKKPVEKPKVDSRAVYQGKSSSNPSTEGAGEGKQGTSGNQGDDTGKEGNKGVPGGTEGAATYKGTPGGGTGLEIYGWEWDNIPKPDIEDNQTGRIVFLIEVDSNGELIRYQKESGTVSAAAERACIEAIQKLTFTKKTGAKVPDISKGKITFVIRAQ